MLPIHTGCIRKNIFLTQFLQITHYFLNFSSRLWEIARLGGAKDRAESGWPHLAVHGVTGCQGCCPSESLDEWTLLHPFPHEEQCSAAWLRPYSTSWYPELLCSALQKNPGEWTICCDYSDNCTSHKQVQFNIKHHSINYLSWY